MRSALRRPCRSRQQCQEGLLGPGEHSVAAPDEPERSAALPALEWKIHQELRQTLRLDGVCREKSDTQPRLDRALDRFVAAELDDVGRLTTGGSKTVQREVAGGGATLPQDVLAS